MSKFDAIRFYDDDQVSEIIKNISEHPIFQALIKFTFPEKSKDEIDTLFNSIHSIFDFHHLFVSHTLRKVVKETSEGLSTSGFEQLESDKSYLFISNHRDILLDTGLLNIELLSHGKIMTASAIGDNLVRKKSHLTLAKLNRNFIVKRNLPPRELLESSKLISEYIFHLLKEQNRSVWIAQREGRTKDGWDSTHQGVLKMIGMHSDEEHLMNYFKKLRIVPVSISYEYDPTDKLKIPQLMAKLQDIEYIKDKNEDFNNILSGVIGQKKRIHIHIGKPLDNELDIIREQQDNTNKQIQQLAKTIDKEIVKNYQLWPTNYIAYDLLHQTNMYADKYTEQEKKLFVRRLELKVDKENPQEVNGFLTMYANPVLHKNTILNE